MCPNNETPDTSTSQSPGKSSGRTESNKKTETSVRYSSLEGNLRFSQTVLNVGFGFALLLSLACLILSTVYLYKFLSIQDAGIESLIQKVGTTLSAGSLEAAINGRLVMARLSLLSCGVSAGLSFGFLGFALFLFGIRKEIDVQAEYESLQIKFGRMSPGVLVILISAFLIGICATRETPFWYETQSSETSKEETKTKGENSNQDNSNRRDLPPPTIDKKP